MSQPLDRKAKYCELAALSLCAAHVSWASRSHNATSGCKSPFDATSLDWVHFCGKRGMKTAEHGRSSRGNRPFSSTGSSVIPPVSGAEDVVNLEWLVDLAEPL